MGATAEILQAIPSKTITIEAHIRTLTKPSKVSGKNRSESYSNLKIPNDKGLRTIVTAYFTDIPTAEPMVLRYSHI
jgi:hypothetical protein